MNKWALALVLIALKAAAVPASNSLPDKVSGTNGILALNNVAAPKKEPPPPVSARDFFNAGTDKLNAGKLKEAEAMLETALAKQVEQIRPNALYNLGHIRYSEGIEELKKAMTAGTANATANMVGD